MQLQLLAIVIHIIAQAGKQRVEGGSVIPKERLHRDATLGEVGHSDRGIRNLVALYSFTLAGARSANAHLTRLL